jgi:hypothetical protein
MGRPVRERLATKRSETMEWEAASSLALRRSPLDEGVITVPTSWGDGGRGRRSGPRSFGTELRQFTTIRAKRTSQLRYFSHKGRHNWPEKATTVDSCRPKDVVGATLVVALFARGMDGPRLARSCHVDTVAAPSPAKRATTRVAPTTGRLKLSTRTQPPSR